MTHKTVTTQAANLVLAAKFKLICTKCDGTSWRLANPAFQAKAAEGKTVLKCNTCASNANKKWYETHDEAKKEASREYRAQPEVKAKSAEYQKAYAAEHREAKNATSSAYAKRHPKRATARVMKRHADKLQRTPVWADLAEIALVYKNCPVGMHVDHIVPLRGELVSGLHTVENLQYLTPEQNSSKGNKFLVE